MSWVSRNSAALLLALIAFASATAAQETCPEPHWVGAYVPGWAQEDSARFADHEFDSVHYLLHFAVFVRRDGSLDLRNNELTPARMRSLVAEGHGSGRKVLLVVGGESAEKGLRVASSPKNLPHTVQALTDLVATYGYDGIDVDWEPLRAEDAQLYAAAIRSLRQSLDALSARAHRPRPLLTAAVQVDLNDEPYMRSLTRTLAELRPYLDQVNLMTYTMADPRELPFIWHNSALYPAARPPVPGFRTPNVDEAVGAFLAAGFEPGQLGIGINLHGYVWRSKSSADDLSRPGAVWKSRPRISELSYQELMSRYFSAARSRWDSEAQVPYLSLPERRMFVSYEDQRSIEQKVAYARAHHIGGLILWDTGGTRAANANRRLLQAVDDALSQCAPGAPPSRQ